MYVGSQFSVHLRLRRIFRCLRVCHTLLLVHPRHGHNSLFRLSNPRLLALLVDKNQSFNLDNMQFTMDFSLEGRRHQVDHFLKRILCHRQGV